jgi:hypothetical protein
MGSYPHVLVPPLSFQQQPHPQRQPCDENGGARSHPDAAAQRLAPAPVLSAIRPDFHANSSYKTHRTPCALLSHLQATTQAHSAAATLARVIELGSRCPVVSPPESSRCRASSHGRGHPRTFLCVLFTPVAHVAPPPCAGTPSSTILTREPPPIRLRLHLHRGEIPHPSLFRFVQFLCQTIAGRAYFAHVGDLLAAGNGRSTVPVVISSWTRRPSPSSIFGRSSCIRWS